jgi:hypothetical protein
LATTAIIGIVAGAKIGSYYGLPKIGALAGVAMILGILCAIGLVVAKLEGRRSRNKRPGDD